MRWKEYSALNESEKASYFDENAPFVHRSTIESHFGGSQVPVQLFVDKGFVDVIIGNMLFQDDDSNDETTKERALSIFEDVLDLSEGNCDGCDYPTFSHSLGVDGQSVCLVQDESCGCVSDLDLKKPSVAPSSSWWNVLMFIRKISAEATINFRSLEGLATIVSQQREGLRRLHAVYVRLFNASGPLSVDDANAVDLGIAVLSEDREYSLQLSNVTAELEDLGLFVAGKIEETGANAMAELVKGLAVCTVNLIAGVISIVAERDSPDEAAAEMPPVLPQQLACFEAESSVTF